MATKYHLTELAKQSPLLIPLPSTGEYVGVGGPYTVNAGENCGSCSQEQKKAFAAKNAGKPQRQYREALPHEYLEIAEAYRASNGIPSYLIIIPDTPVAEEKPKQQSQQKVEPVEEKK